MIVRSKKEDSNIDKLKKVFDVTRKNNMKLNPNKCSFEVSAGKFLEFMITQ